MGETESLPEVVRLAKARAENAKEKVIQIYSIAYLVSRFDSLKQEDPPDFCSHDVIHTMALFANQLDQVVNDLIGIIGDLRSVGEQELVAQVE